MYLLWYTTGIINSSHFFMKKLRADEKIAVTIAVVIVLAVYLGGSIYLRLQQGM